MFVHFSCLPLLLAEISFLKYSRSDLLILLFTVTHWNLTGKLKLPYQGFHWRNSWPVNSLCSVSREYILALLGSPRISTWPHPWQGCWQQKSLSIFYYFLVLIGKNLRPLLLRKLIFPLTSLRMGEFHFTCHFFEHCRQFTWEQPAAKCPVCWQIQHLICEA